MSEMLAGLLQLIADLGPGRGKRADDEDTTEMGRSEAFLLLAMIIVFAVGFPLAIIVTIVLIITG